MKPVKVISKKRKGLTSLLRRSYSTLFFTLLYAVPNTATGTPFPNDLINIYYSTIFERKSILFVLFHQEMTTKFYEIKFPGYGFTI